MLLIEDASMRRKEDNPGTIELAADVLDRCDQRFRLHHHPLPAAVRVIVSDVMAVGGVSPQVHQTHGDEIFLLSLLQDTVVQKGGEHIREQCNDRKIEHRFAGTNKIGKARGLTALQGG